MAEYDFDGEEYEQASQHQKEWGMNLLSELKLTGQEVILDLGCGDGKLTARLAREEVLSRARKLERVQEYLAGKEVRKVVYVQDRILNFVVK
ncbi:MAG: hypothetical protein ACOC2G_04320 [Bacillota bacterium]